MSADTRSDAESAEEGVAGDVGGDDTARPDVSGEPGDRVTDPPHGHPPDAHLRGGLPPEAPRPLVTPPIDIYETDEGLVLVADLPGVSGQSVDVRVQDNRLVLYGRRSPDTPPDASVAHQEFIEADFLRSFILSHDVDHRRIEASLENGVLHVTLPRQQQGRSRKIDVAVG